MNRNMRELQRLIKTANKQAAKIQKQIDAVQTKCPHLRIQHRLFRDVYAGQGESCKCLDCGKFMGCSTSQASPIVTKTWTERRKTT